MSDPANGQWIQLTASDGHRLDAYQVRPSGDVRGEVVVIQEIFGVNGHVRSVAAELARAGYLATAPALFDRVRPKVELGYDKAGIDEGLEIRKAISFDAALLDVEAALQGTSGTRIVIGFCWGGTLSWLAASRLPVRAAVAYYGGQIGSLLDDAPARPTLTHFGETDGSIPLEVPKAVGERYPTVVKHLYPAGHGFNCSERGSYHEASARLAWRRTLGFMEAVI